MTQHTQNASAFTLEANADFSMLTLIYKTAGWHCSFCFRTIKEFVFKMTSYSHADRVRGDQILSKDHIQDVVCTGKDIFGMYPEVYSYKDLVAQWDGAPKSDSAVGLPKTVLEDDKFSFLLPGGCQRQLE
jgi:hypothetical protein